MTPLFDWKNLTVWLVPNPTTRYPLTWTTFLCLLLPPLVYYSIMAHLVCTPGTYKFRFWLALPGVLLAYIAGIKLDIAASVPYERMEWMNEALTLGLTTLATRLLSWGTRPNHLIRSRRPQRCSNGAHDKANNDEKNLKHNNATAPSTSSKTSSWDPFDLMFNLRGLTWDWSHGVHIPAQHSTAPSHNNVASSAKIPTRTANSRLAIPLPVYRFVSGILGIVAFDFLHVVIVAFIEGQRGDRQGTKTPCCAGVSIFELTPLNHTHDYHTWAFRFVERYTKTCGITLLSGTAIYTFISAIYNLLSSFCLSFLSQHESQWPPLFDSPWLADSLSSFWGERWHQVFRECFLTYARLLASAPPQIVQSASRTLLPPFAVTAIKRLNLLFVVFFASGVFHVFGNWGMGRGANFRSVCGPFVLMGVGVAIEGIVNHNKAKNPVIRGRLGQIWTWTWLLVCNQFLVDAWIRSGLVGSNFFPWMEEGHRPGMIIAAFLSQAGHSFSFSGVGGISGEL